MNSSSQNFHKTIDPHYKQGDPFARDEAYYSQFLTNTRRSKSPMGRKQNQSSVNHAIRGNTVQSKIYKEGHQQYGSINVEKREEGVYNSRVEGGGSRVQGRGGSRVEGRQQYVNVQQQIEGRIDSNQQYVQTDPIKLQNQRLRYEIQDIMDGESDYGTYEQVIKLNHYYTQEELTRIREQEGQIEKLNYKIKMNYTKIENYKKASQELQVRMNNIQSVDREIYKNLKEAVNRDKQLLDRATAALARGEKREEVAAILQQVLTS